MFEVVLTYRDFSEHPVDRYATQAEALEVARRVSVQMHDKIIRAWVKQVREVKTGS